MAESFVSCQSIFYPVIMVKNICMYTNFTLKITEPNYQDNTHRTAQVAYCHRLVIFGMAM